jgi:hypothetical protein
VVLPFDAGVIALLYMDRRMRREGLDLDLRTRGRSAAALAAASGRDEGGGSGAGGEGGSGDGNGHAGDGDSEGFIDLWRPRPAGAWHGTGSEAGARR